MKKMMKQYKIYEKNLINFLEMNLEDMEVSTKEKILHNFERQLKECEENDNLASIIQIGIDMIKKELM